MGLFDSGEAKTGPLDWQRQPIRDIFKRSTMATDRLAKAGPPKVGMFAGMTDPTRNGINQLTDFANGVGGELAGGIANSAKSNTAAGANFGNNAADLYGRYGQGGAAGAIQGMTAGFMNDPILQAQIDAATGDVARAFGEEDVGRANAASADGMARSTRAGVEAAIDKRGAKDRAGAIAAGMRSDAYGRAQGLAADAYSTDANLALATNDQIGGAARLGAGLAGDAVSVNNGVAGANLQAGGLMQQEEQRKIDEARGLHRERNGGYQLDLQRDLYGIIGGQSWGQQQSGGDGGMFGKLAGTGLALAPGILGGIYGGPAGMMAGFGMSNTGGMPSTWS